MKIFLLLASIFLASSSSFAIDDDQMVQDLQTMQEDMKKALVQIQEKTAGVDGEKMAKAKEKVLRLASDEHFLKSAEQVFSHPNRLNLMLLELAFFVVMIFIKGWRQAAAKNWFKRILVGFGFWWLTWIGMLVVLPYIMLGEPFRVFVFSLVKLLFA